jgi:F-type H+-transporting ATPase subunit delta
VSPAAVRLVVAAVTDLRGRSLESALGEIEALIAARRDRVVAVVRVAHALTPTQRADLATRLARTVGRTVQLNMIEDPSVLGGFRAEVGDTVIDASVATRLADARRRLVG